VTDAVGTVLFDLDGTLLDTAPDLGAALNRLLADTGRAPLALEQIRPHVSHGSRALLRLGLGVEPGDPAYEGYRTRLLDHYLRHIATHSRLFPGMEQVLDHMAANGISWGVVTNKPGWLTLPLMDALDLTRHAACIVSGDTTDHPKPHPAPLLHACRTAGTAPERCLFVGDAERDLVAGRAAGMTSLVALFGYIDAGEAPHTWGADGYLEGPLDLLQWL